MTSIAKKEIQLTQKERGATMVEYAIMVALIAIVSIAVISGVGQQVNTTFGKVNNYISTANGG